MNKYNNKLKEIIEILEDKIKKLLKISTKKLEDFLKILQEKIKIILTILINYIRKMPRNIKFILVAIFIFIFIVIFCVIGNIKPKEMDKQKSNIYTGKNLDNKKYPGYKELIDKLQEEHPNWTFKLFYTKLNWDEVIKEEGHSDSRKNPLNLIPDTLEYPKDWRCEKDKDKKFDNGTWVCASDKAIKYQMDPRNMLDDENIFQFEELNYIENAQTLKGIKEKTKDSFLEGDSVAQAILDAGKKENLNPYFIASRLIQEQGKKGTKLSQGFQYQEKLLYNPFNIGATGNSQVEIIENAVKYANSKDWDTLEKGLLGGIHFISEKYIDKGQNTIYFQKFDVISEDGKLYQNQYMQNLLAPTSEASSLLDEYIASSTQNARLSFIIPLYEGMPKEPSEK